MFYKLNIWQKNVDMACPAGYNTNCRYGNFRENRKVACILEGKGTRRKTAARAFRRSAAGRIAQNSLQEFGGTGMSTTMPKASEMTRKWYILDAADKPLGRTAATAASILRGKMKADFAPNVDCGDHVIIINAEKAILTGRKLEQKKYYRHSGWIGGLKEVGYDKLMKERPEQAMMLAVKGMIPDTVIGRAALTRCRIFRGAEHTHAAQKPQAWTL